ncbi:MAG: S8 family serine peptidase [Bacteroidota bacterium]|nr:MAG: S8 family serine peptidase [Bacteroidota bacterium]
MSNYSGNSSVIMSDFSNWGPTDDGRIKPDLCANGVGVYSSKPFDVLNPLGCPMLNCQYQFLNGTSMASPVLPVDYYSYNSIIKRNTPVPICVQQP